MGGRGDAVAWDRWAGLAACGGLFLVVHVHRFALGTLAGWLMAEFGASAVEMGGLTSLYFCFYGAAQFPAGIMADTLAPRRTLLASGLCLTGGALLSAWAPDLGVAYAGRVLVGLGAAPVFVCAIRLIASWFDPLRFATLVGLINFTGNVGGFVAGVPLAAASEALGWRSVFWGLGALTLVATGVCWLVVRDRPRVAEVAAPVTLGESLRAAASALRNREVWKAIAAKMGLDAGNFVFFAAWGVPYLSQVYELSPAAASRYVSIGVVGFALGAPAHGLLSDRVFRGRRVPLLLAATAYLGAWIAVLVPPGGAHGPALFGVVAFLMGFLAASLLLTLSIARDQAPERAAGVATALVNGSGFLGGAVLQVVVSAILDALWDGRVVAGARVYSPEAFRAAFLTCLAAALLAVVAAASLREPRRPDPRASAG